MSRPDDGAPIVDPTNGAHEHPTTVVETLTAAAAGGQWRTAPLKPTTSTGADLALAPGGLTWAITVEIKRGATWHEVIVYEVAPSGDRNYVGASETVTVAGTVCIDVNALIPPPASVPPAAIFEDAVLEVLDAHPEYGAADLTVSRTSTTVTVVSATGTDATLPPATTSLAGQLTAADKAKLDAVTGTNTGDQATRVYPYLKATDGSLSAAIAADFAAGRLAIGDAVQTASYWQGLRLGGCLYHLVAAATGTVDGGSYINGSGYQLQAAFPTRPMVTQFGAKGDGSTDDTAAIQAAVTFGINSGARSVFFPFSRRQRYRLTSTVTILSSGFTLAGDATPVYDPQNGPYVFADSAVATLFDYGAGGNSYGANQFVVSGMSFYGSSGVTQSAVKVSQNDNGPHRGVLIRGCCATRFANVVLFDVPTAGFLAAASAVVESCVFTANINALNSVDKVLGLRYVGNQSEQGARIVGAFDSGITIEDNMLEGQTNTINIESGAPIVRVRNNYFEANTGDYILRVKATNSGGGSLHIGQNFLAAAPSTLTDVVRVEGSMKISERERFGPSTNRNAELTLVSATVAPGSYLNGKVYVGTASGEGSQGFIDPRPLAGAMPATASVNKSLGAVTLVTPFGQTTTGATVNGFPSTYYSISKTWSSGDVVVGCALVWLEANGSEAPSCYFYNESFSNFGQIGQLVFTQSAGDQWYVMWSAFAAQSSGTSFKFRFGSNGTGAGSTSIHVAAVGADVIPAASFESLNSTSRAYVQLFNPYVP